MKRLNLTIGWGVLLILAGLLLLGQIWDSTLAVWPWVWAALAAVTGVSFLVHFWQEPRGWWAAIPAFPLLGLSAVILLSTLNWGPDTLIGALFLASISLGFWAVYARRRDFWWAIIPGGTMLSVAAVPLIAEPFPQLAGSVLFFGMAITFGLLMVLPTQQGPQRWAGIPAAVMLVLALVTLSNWPGAANLFWALALIAAGLYIVYRQRGGEIARRR